MQELAAALGSLPDSGESGRALDNLVVRLRKKLREQTGADPIATLRGVGYGFTAEVTIR